MSESVDGEHSWDLRLVSAVVAAVLMIWGRPSIPDIVGYAYSICEGFSEKVCMCMCIEFEENYIFYV